MSQKAMEKVVSILGKGVKFCDDCVKENCKFRGIVFDCDEKILADKVSGDEKNNV